MVLETERTILRPFTIDDAADLYAYAQDPQVGLAAGWKPHQSIKDSRHAIQTVFSAPAVFAIVYRETGRVIGSAGYIGRTPTECPKTSMSPHMQDGVSDELGFALNPTYWGRGIMPEVVRELLRYGFERLGLHAVWSVHYAENDRCRRVLEKCGFTFVFQENLMDRIARETKFYVLLWQDWRRREKASG